MASPTFVAPESTSGPKQLISAGNKVARCFSMIVIGTVEDTYQGETKSLLKIRLGFEFPNNKTVFKEEKGPEPFTLYKEYTFSMNEKATFRKDLESWRGRSFTEEQARAFDAGKLLGVPCTINVIEYTTKGGVETRKINAITPMMEGLTCPDQINPTQALNYNDFDWSLFDKLPGYLQEKIKSSKEYAAMVEAMEKKGKNDFLTSDIGGPGDQEDEKVPF